MLIFFHNVEKRREELSKIVVYHQNEYGIWKHITTCQTIKKWKHSKLTCPYCKVTFSQKFNRDRHVKNIHQKDTLVLAHGVTEADENTFNDLVDFNAD